MIQIPKKFFQVHYIAARIPGVEDPSNLDKGANCQLFAYEVLKHFGHVIPNFRSSDLWEDETCTVKVDVFLPLDLMLYHRKLESYGAHVGLYLGDGKVIHLAQTVGKPEVMDHDDFALQEKYAYFIGAKRLITGVQK